MKIVRYRYDNETAYGVCHGEMVSTPRHLLRRDGGGTIDCLIRLLESEGTGHTRSAGTGDALRTSAQANARALPLGEVALLAPVSPGKIIALGYNYKDLVGEREAYDEPVIFFKPPSAVIGPGEPIVLKENRKVWTEVELAIVIGTTCRNVSPRDAPDFILGHTIANDVTMSNCLGRDHHLARSKGWDTFCPLGPAIFTGLDTSSLEMSNSINGRLMQSSSTAKRILNDAEVVSFLSHVCTLEPGDVILTGTPANAENSVIRHGDRVSVSLEGLGTLTNTVRADL
ncbi:MAG: FAA hydrolase family protein [Puniceicoccaceae bacterium]|nr:MAG: FAA hydrolase family protein [Puniceicoccaceae bacterium]